MRERAARLLERLLDLLGIATVFELLPRDVATWVCDRGSGAGLGGSLLRKSCARFILSTEYLCRLLSALGGETNPPPVP